MDALKKGKQEKVWVVSTFSSIFIRIQEKLGFLVFLAWTASFPTADKIKRTKIISENTGLVPDLLSASYF